MPVAIESRRRDEFASLESCHACDTPPGRKRLDGNRHLKNLSMAPGGRCKLYKCDTCGAMCCTACEYLHVS